MSIRAIKPEPTLTDWARLAMAIDGEGNIDIYESVTTIKGKRYTGFYLRVSVFNTDPRLPVWCQSIVGGMVTRRKSQRKGWRPCFVWSAGSRLAAKVLRQCTPYFVTKPEQASVALAFLQTMGKCGGKVSEGTRQLRRAYKHQLMALKWMPREIENRNQNEQ